VSTIHGGPLNVTLISRDNGVGLTADMDLLGAMLTGAGHHVQRVDWRAPRMTRADVAIFLELWNPNLARYAKRVVGVFNLEWFQQGWARDLPRVHQLWAKSAEAHAAYQRMHLRQSTLTGFLSRDMMDPAVPREPVAFHLRGHSDFKNTAKVIETWRRDPKLPPLTIVSAVPLEVPAHVRLLGRIPDEELRREMNRATYHVCPSRAEGWGHYITEAMSVGAVVVTTDASPMNEHIRPEWGALVPSSSAGRHGLVSVHGISARSLGEAMRRVVALPEDTRARMGQRAREHFHHRNATFTATALDLLARI
jgi:hypothetical protein